MVKNNVLKKLLVTASGLAIVAGGGASALGANIETTAPIWVLDTAGGGGAANIQVIGGAALAPFTNGDFLRIAHDNGTHTGNINAISAISVEAPATVAGFTTADALSIGSIKGSGVNVLKVNVNGAHALTLTGTGANGVGANDYSGLQNITLSNANAELAVNLANANDAITLSGTIDGNAAGNGLISVTKGKVTFANKIGNASAVKSLTVGDNGTAILGADAKFDGVNGNAGIAIGNTGKVIVNNGVKIIGVANGNSVDIKGAALNNGTLIFEGASEVDSMIGNANSLKSVQIGNGEVKIKSDGNGAASVVKAQEIKFTHANGGTLTFTAQDAAVTGNLITDFDGKGVVKIDNKTVDFTGIIGGDGTGANNNKDIEKVEMNGANSVLSLVTADLGAGNSALRAKIVSTNVQNQGKIRFVGNQDITTQLGESGKELELVELISNKAGAAGGTFFLKNKIYANKLDLNNGGIWDNTLELHDGSEIHVTHADGIMSTKAGQNIINVKGNALIDGNIKTGGNNIKGLVFDTAGKTLTHKSTAVGGLTNEIKFTADATYKLTSDDSIILSAKNADAVAISLTADNQGSLVINDSKKGKTVTLKGAIGEIQGLAVTGAAGAAAADKGLKLLSVTGGADVKFETSAANHGRVFNIKTLDIGSADATIELGAINNALDVAVYKIGELKHDNGSGTLKISQDSILASGTKLTEATKQLKKVNFAADKTLTLGAGVDLYLSEGIENTAAGSGSLVFNTEDTKTTTVKLGKKLGENNSFGNIKVTTLKAGSGTVVIDSVIRLENGKSIEIGNNTTLVINKDVIKDGASINIKGSGANEGILKLTNTADLEIQAKVGDGSALKVVDINGGGNIKVTDDTFKTQKLDITTDKPFELDLKTVTGANFVVPTISTASKTNNQTIIFGDSIDLSTQAVGTKDQKIGAVKIDAAAAKTFTFGDNNFVNAVKTEQTNMHVVVLNGANVESSNIGEAGKVFETLTITKAKSVTNAYANKIELAAGQTTSFAGTIVVDKDDAKGLRLSDDNSIAKLEDGIKLSGGNIYAVINTKGEVQFQGGGEFYGNIGTTTNQVKKITTANTDKTLKLGGDYVTSESVMFGETKLDFTKGNTTITAPAITLASKDVNVGTSTVKFVGETTLNNTLVTLQSTGAVNGSIDVDTLAHVKTNGAVKIGIKVTKLSDKEFYAFTVGGKKLDDAGINDLTFELNSADLSNIFASATVNSKTSLVTQKNIASEAATEILNKFSGKSVDGINITFSAADNAFFADNKESDLVSDLGVLGAEQGEAAIVEAYAKLREPAAAVAGQVVQGATSSAVGVVSNRMNSLSTPAAIKVTDAGVGVAAGDEVLSSRLGAWAMGTYSSDKQKAHRQISGYDAKTGTITIGVDARPGGMENLVLGAAFTYADTKVKHKNISAGNKTKIGTMMLSLYATHKINDSLFIDAIGSVGTSDVRLSQKRIESTGTNIATAKYDSVSYGLETKLGYNYNVSDVVITPVAGLAFNRFMDGGYTEKGAVNQNLTINKKAANKLEGILGANVTTAMDVSGITVSPEAHANIRYDFIGKGAKVDARVVGAGALPVQTAKVERLKTNLGLGVNAVSGMMEYYAGYDFTMAKKFTGHQGSLKVRVNF